MNAQHWANRVGLEIRWEDDWSVGSHVVEYGEPVYSHEPATCERAAAFLSNAVLASLGCIDDADDDYREEIETELQQEAYDYVLGQWERMVGF